MSEPTLCSICRLSVVLNGVIPVVWRRLLLSSETNLADLHEILQLAFGWSGFYLYEFRIHGRTFGEERSVCLADLQLHPGERFRYCYNFFVFRECDVRLEAILPHQGESTHPRCVGGRQPAPDEDDGGAWGYQQLHDHYKFAPLEAASLLAEITQSALKKGSRAGMVLEELAEATGRVEAHLGCGNRKLDRRELNSGLFGLNLNGGEA